MVCVSGMAQAVRLERPVFRFCRVGEGDGWLGNVLLDRRKVHVCSGHGERSGSGSAFGSCSSQGLPVHSRNASPWSAPEGVSAVSDGQLAKGGK